ncbi:unnamed protein product (macronuclear) [Paramecium tetraurelia]|uniref:Uncharacterized protein n=1 Tax=Paramecium tetraurelia TaxID=5888 RepID=A0EG53_PARTE|nr:uncharacterized protein GSPATT00026617001 [Paramecium tetraurelia]CAK94294.1 unnamed protein product [Paramecium tetraurelia]|eukprot:XP_001461667.1 hypothetical protein (macronuclear) [Paramecium tetraurelia strain d4-2]
MGQCTSKKQKRILLNKQHQSTSSNSQTPIQQKGQQALNLQNIQSSNLHGQEKNEIEVEEKASPPPKLYFNGNQPTARKESIFGRPKVQSVRLSQQNFHNHKEEVIFGRKVHLSHPHLLQ